MKWILDFTKDDHLTAYDKAVKFIEKISDIIDASYSPHQKRVLRVIIEEMIFCPKCGASATKFGKPAGRQRYKCAGCNHIFMESRT